MYFLLSTSGCYMWNVQILHIATCFAKRKLWTFSETTIWASASAAVALSGLLKERLWGQLSWSCWQIISWCRSQENVSVHRSSSWNFSYCMCRRLCRSFSAPGRVEMQISLFFLLQEFRPDHVWSLTCWGKPVRFLLGVQSKPRLALQGNNIVVRSGLCNSDMLFCGINQSEFYSNLHQLSFWSSQGSRNKLSTQQWHVSLYHEVLATACIILNFPCCRPALLAAAENFTVLIKNNIRFPAFNFIRWDCWTS